MAINDTIKYVTSAPKKVGAAITAAPKKIQQGAQNLADLPSKAYQRADEGIHQVATQFNNMKTPSSTVGGSFWAQRRINIRIKPGFAPREVGRIAQKL